MIKVNKQRVITAGTTALISAATLMGNSFAADESAGSIIAGGLTTVKGEILSALALILVPAMAIFGFKQVAKQGFSFWNSSTK